MALLPPHLRSVLSATTTGEVRVEIGAGDSGDVLDAALRLEEEILRHRPASLYRDGALVVFRGPSTAWSFDNAAIVERCVVRIERDGSAYLARWETSFGRTRLLLAGFAAVAAVWMLGGALFDASRPGAAMEARSVVVPLVGPPLMCLVGFVMVKASAAERVAKLLRRALAVRPALQDVHGA